MSGALVALLVADAQLHVSTEPKTSHRTSFAPGIRPTPNEFKLLDGHWLVVCRKPVVSDDMDEDDDVVTVAFCTCQLTKYEVLLVN